jgi:VWFA-related protein
MAHLHRNARICAVLVAALTLLPAEAQQQQSANGESNPATIFFTVLDKDKHFVKTLRKEDIRVVEDGAPQEITAFEQQTDQPLSLAILIDASLSQERTLQGQKLAARAFVDRILRPGRDQAALITFTGQATLEQPLTSDMGLLRQAIARVEFEPPLDYLELGQVTTKPSGPSPGQSVQGSTAIWDAVWLAADEILSQASEKTRRAIILLTDGNDTSSHKKIDEAVERALKTGAMIYSIGIGDKYYGEIGKGALRKVSERTGGRVFFPEKVKDLVEVFAEIEQSLNSQYLVSYLPANRKRDDKFHKVRIEIINPELRKQELHLWHQQGYYAKKG